jgi:hypothetical protein
VNVYILPLFKGGKVGGCVGWGREVSFKNSSLIFVTGELIN